MAARWHLRKRGELESFGQFFRESAMRALGASIGTRRRAFVLPAASLPARAGGWRSPIHLSGLSGALTLTLAGNSGLRRLSLIGAQQPVFQRGTVETADDQIHLFRVGCIDEGEPLRFLGLRIADYLDVIVDEVFCVKPGLDVVLRNPDRQISKEHCETHSVVSLTPFSGIGRNCFADAIHES